MMIHDIISGPMEEYFIEGIKKAVAYIDNNLNKKISLGELSDAAGISKFHFHKIFRAFTGESIYDTVIRLRLENSARLLNESSKPVGDIAARSGFTDTESFSSAFRNNFSMSPSAWRRKCKSSGQGTAIPQHSLITPGPEEVPNLLSSVVRKVNGFSIAYIRHTGAYAGDSALIIYLYNKLTTWAGSRDLLNPEQQNVVIYHDPVFVTEDSRIKISLGISVPEDTRTGGDIGKMKLLGGNYLICRYNLRDEEYTGAWDQVYRKMLPELNLTPTDGFSFEMYPTDVKSDDRHSSIVDIYVPVEKEPVVTQ